MIVEAKSLRKRRRRRRRSPKRALQIEVTRCTGEKDMASEAVLTRVRAQMRGLRAPTSPTDRVHKDECVLSFDTPASPDGIYVKYATRRGLEH